MSTCNSEIQDSSLLELSPFRINCCKDFNEEYRISLVFYFPGLLQLHYSLLKIMLKLVISGQENVYFVIPKNLYKDNSGL